MARQRVRSALRAKSSKPRPRKRSKYLAPVTLTQLKTAAAAYLQCATTDFTVGGLDLWLLAANQTRILAESNFDFEFSRARFSLAVLTDAGASLSTATFVEGDVPVTNDPTTIIDVTQADTDGNLRPVEWTTLAESNVRQRSDNPGYSVRYPTDGQALSSPNGRARLTFSGNWVRVFPRTTTSETLTIYLEAYTKWADWVAGDLSTEVEPWSTVGQQFLLWGTIIHLNHLKKEFTPRTEGNLGPPTQLRDEGLETLKQWDAFRYEQFRRHQR